MKIDTTRQFGVRECPNCATEVPANNNRCPICGYVFLTPTPLQRDMRFWGAILMLVLFLIMIFGLM